MLLSPLALVPLLAGLVSVLGHPGESHHTDANELAAKRDFLTRSSIGLRSCSGNSRKRSLDEFSARRESHIRELRDGLARGLKKRQGGMQQNVTWDPYGEALLNTSHASNRTDLTANSTTSTIFDSEAVCLLQPEATIGPYWVAGEYIRYDVSEDQGGIPLYLAVQLLDTSSCAAVPDAMFEIWHCNATGVYSGVETTLNSTFLRGMQKTDELGAATLKTIFPGHYTGRATHVHIIAHTNYTEYANGTIGTGPNGDGNSTTIHIGQLFFDQDLISTVEAVSPYTDNTQTLTTNEDDDILAGEAVDGSPDPLMEYVWLSNNVEDGIYAWVTIGVDSNSSYTASPAVYLTPDGGIENANSGMDGGGMGGENGTAPGNGSMAAPNGTGGTSGTFAVDAASASSSTLSTGSACKRRRSVLRK